MRPWFDSWVEKILWRRERLPTPVFLGFADGSAGKESSCNVRDLGSIPGLGRFSGEGHGNLLQYSCLENPMDRGAWRVTDPRVAKRLNWSNLAGMCQYILPFAKYFLVVFVVPLFFLLHLLLSSLVAQLVKNPPATGETWVPSLGWEDPLEKGKATHSSILAWRSPWTI